MIREVVRSAAPGARTPPGCCRPETGETVLSFGGTGGGDSFDESVGKSASVGDHNGYFFSSVYDGGGDCGDDGAVLEGRFSLRTYADSAAPAAAAAVVVLDALAMRCAGRKSEKEAVRLRPPCLRVEEL